MKLPHHLFALGGGVSGTAVGVEVVAVVVVGVVDVVVMIAHPHVADMLVDGVRNV